ncbi:MAG: hypothetical protein HQ521_07620 [Bacteroidetes bacterium]|nr:hypothetical protein [Bacteroidota bacterium]
MAKRKSQKKSTKNNKSFTIFFVIVIIIAIISFAITYVVMQNDTGAIVDAIKVEKEVTTPKTVIEKSSLEGTWASYNDGAMLTIVGLTFTIELPSVEATITASGKIVVNDNVITFINTSEKSDCNVKPGIYSFSIQDNSDLTFKKIDDDCKSRITQIEAAWFKV